MLKEKDIVVNNKGYSVRFWAEGEKEFRIIVTDVKTGERIINIVTSNLVETIKAVQNILEDKEKKVEKLSKVQEIFVNREGLEQEFE